QSASVPDADALAHAVGSADPAGVQQPAIDVVTHDLTLEQVGVVDWRVDHERRAKARAEGYFGLCAEAHFGAGDLRRVPGDEMIGGLVGGHAGDGGHHALGIAGEEYYVFRVAAPRLRQGVVDIIQRVGGARVLGGRVVVQIDVAGGAVVDDILQDGPEH